MKLNIVDKHLTMLTREEFETNMKALLRWAKENGCYALLCNYLEKKDDIYKAIKTDKLRYSPYTFGEALGLFAFIETKYEELGYQDWCDRIQEYYLKWKKFYKANWLGSNLE